MCKVYEFEYDCGHCFDACLSKCQGAFVTPGTRHLRTGRRKACRQYASLCYRLSGLCGDCKADAAEPEYRRMHDSAVQEIWRLYLSRAAAQELEVAQFRLLEVEKGLHQAKASLPGRNLAVEPSRYADRRRSRGSLLRNEVHRDDIAAPWDVRNKGELLEESQCEWRKDDTAASGSTVDWDSDWEAEHIVLR